MIATTQRRRRTTRAKYLIKPALLLLLLSQLLATSPIVSTQASSASYLDDYFSTAKYALNKLQQSLTATSGGPLRQTTDEPAAADKSTSTTTIATISEATSPPKTEAPTEVESGSSSEPDRNEFVKVLEGAVTSSSEVSPKQQGIGSNERAEDSTAIFVSAQTDEQTDTETVTKPAAEVVAFVGLGGSGRTDDGPSLVVEEPAVASSKSDSKPTTTTTTTTTINEDVIKETELNAVAAVDLSMGFGNDLNLFQSEKEPCYDEYGNPRFCEPEFENVAFERQVEVSSECGQPASRFCTTSASGASGQAESQIRNCHICDAQHPKKRHPASYLTDLSSSQTPTCWVSAPIQVATSSNDTTTSSSSIGSSNTLEPSLPPIRGDNVTLVVNLDKRYEILYVSMQFCSLKPDSLAIYKSNDFGQSWQPYQFYSSHCARLYNRQQQQQQLLSSTSSKAAVQSTTANGSEVSCVNVSSSGSSATRVAFSTLEGARVGLNLDKSPALQEWISATNIRITLDRHQAAWIHSTLALHSSRSHPSTADSLQPQPQRSSSNSSTSTTDAIVATTAGQESSQQLTNPSSDTFNYAIADLTIGARCKCNGHASRCIHGKEGRLQCDCRHNTAGRDCEKCAPLHTDRPWARATPTEANICQACNCNGHSRKCRFDPELYRLSGKRSGGVCLQCKDNTDGRYCHYCREGFTRDHSRPMSDKEACKPCDCHPIGSLGRVCNQTSGQCPCKEGVTGLLCNRCAPGYQQSSSQSEPCIKIPPETNNEINNDLGAVVTEATDEQPTIDQAATEADTPVISQDLSTSPQQQEQQPQLPTLRGRPPLASDRWAHENGAGHYWAPPPDRPPPADDSAFMDDDRPMIGGVGYVRPVPSNQYWTAASARKHLSKQPANYYDRYPDQAHLPAVGSALDSRERGSSLDDDDESLEPMPISNDNVAATYGPGRYYSSARQRPLGSSRYRHYQQQQQQQQQHYRHMPPVANLNPEEDDETSPMNQYPHYQTGNTYSDEYNQIGRDATTAHRHYQHLHQQQRSGSTQAQAQARRPSSTLSSAAPTNSISSNVQSNVNSIVGGNQCGDCQSNMRRLKSGKFCELEFAIRCTVLNKLMAEDWTKLDIEIQDIFKSPMGAASHHVSARSPPPPLPHDSHDHHDHHHDHHDHQQQQQPMNPSVESQLAMMQQDAPVASQETAATGPVVSNNKTNADNDIVLQHRLKVGTVQTIWVPTEDLACKCLRLKRGSTYLLMGTIDAKENSVNSLQLDRHGVALEWRPSLQSKMLKLQRKFARGSLCV